MREAQRIQSSLLPTAELHHKAFEIAFRYAPFSEVGGDFADFFELPDGQVGIYVGDVVGKGLPAAMYGALVMGTLRGISKTGVDPAGVLTLLNERLMQRPLPGRFCCTLYALFNPSTRELALSNAGLPPPLLASKSACHSLGEGGLPSGIFFDASYDQHTVALAPGDSVLFATDGLHESRNDQGAEFCAEQLTAAWGQCRNKPASESVEFLFDALHAFAKQDGQHDDVTVVVLKILP